MNTLVPAPAAAVHLHQIAYSDGVLAGIAPGWQVLDHRANDRADWYEYTPIRRHLLSQPLDDAAWYGFFSPKFSAKTGLDHAAAVAAVRDGAARGADCVLFSPQPEMGACFLNVYEQGETFDPGFVDACEGWLRHAQAHGALGFAPPALRALVMDSRHVVFSNYFAARPAFWREWLRVNETLHALCEQGPREIAAPLLAATTYPGAAQRKVFVQERTASLLLALQPRWRSHAVNPFAMAWSRSRLAEDPGYAVAADALKRAWRDHGHGCYLQAWAQLRERFVRAAPAVV